MAFTHEERKQHDKLRAAHLAANPHCEVSKAHGHSAVPATRIHHKKGRKRHYLDPTQFVSVSQWGDAWIHSNYKKAVSMGFIHDETTITPKPMASVPMPPISSPKWWGNLLSLSS